MVNQLINVFGDLNIPNYSTIIVVFQMFWMKSIAVTGY